MADYTDEAFDFVYYLPRKWKSGGEGGARTNYVNRVWDTVAGSFVRWATTSPNPTGTSYPGPGAFGVDTSDYCIERTYAA
jgi:hypothetical protein